MARELKRHLIHGRRTYSQILSDNIAIYAGSWTFIILFGVALAIWILLNVKGAKVWDPYPFILLNLFLSVMAAIQAPIILMSQNISSQRDRLRAEYDYQVNRKAEKEIREIKKQLNRIEEKFK